MNSADTKPPWAPQSRSVLCFALRDRKLTSLPVLSLDISKSDLSLIKNSKLSVPSRFRRRLVPIQMNNVKDCRLRRLIDPVSVFVPHAVKLHPRMRRRRWRTGGRVHVDTSRLPPTGMKVTTAQVVDERNHFVPLPVQSEAVGTL